MSCLLKLLQDKPASSPICLKIIKPAIVVAIVNADSPLSVIFHFVSVVIALYIHARFDSSHFFTPSIGISLALMSERYAAYSKMSIGNTP